MSVASCVLQQTKQGLYTKQLQNHAGEMRYRLRGTCTRHTRFAEMHNFRYLPNSQVHGGCYITMTDVHRCTIINLPDTHHCIHPCSTCHTPHTSPAHILKNRNTEIDSGCMSMLLIDSQWLLCRCTHMYGAAGGRPDSPPELAVGHLMPRKHRHITAALQVLLPHPATTRHPERAIIVVTPP